MTFEHLTLEQKASLLSGKDSEENPSELKMVESMPMQQFLAFIGGAIPAETLDHLMDLSAAEPGTA